MGEVEEDVLRALAWVIIVVLGLLILATAIMPSNFTGTEAGAFSTATGLAYSISGLSIADEGSMTRYLNGSYDVEIGLEKDSNGPLKNYYIRLTPYRNGKTTKQTDKIIFIGNVKTDGKPVKLENVTYVQFFKKRGNPVEMSKITQNRFTTTLCNEPSPEKIKEYILKYSADAEEQKWVKSLIMVESRYVHCSDSYAGAFGLMQLMEIAARDVGISDRFDAEQNIKGGISYLRKLVQRYEAYNDKYVLAVATYNCNAIGAFVADNCEEKNIYQDCWEKEIKKITETKCLGLYNEKQTYNHVDRVQKCAKYYEQNTNCFNAPDTSSKTGECPKSNECGNW
jgi:hypothetical protein